MKFDVKFKSIDFSQALVDYVEERFAKIAKFEIKPVTVHVTFSQIRHAKVTEVYIHGMQGDFRARGESDSLYVSVDMCLKKLKRQMEKEKAKVKNHRHYDRSDEAKLDMLLKQERANRRAA
jgi:putative sigma-54 modulation protein